MKPRSEFAVTLSDELFDQLTSQARRLGVPLKWLVASLVCDTFESCTGPLLCDTEPMRRRSLNLA
jgi:hypothetical protein